jgi:hypothetical protein
MSFVANGTGVASSAPDGLVLGTGTVSAPTLRVAAADTTTGFYRPAANQIGLTISGVAAGLWSSQGLGVTAGAVGAPSIYFLGSATTGIYAPTADQLAISRAGTQVLLMNSNGVFTLSSGTNDSHNLRTAGLNGNPPLRLRNTNSSAVNGRITALQWEDYSGAIADVIAQFDVINGTLNTSNFNTFIGGRQGFRMTGATSGAAFQWFSGVTAQADGRMDTGASISLGLVTVPGAWTWGPSGFTGTHTANGILDVSGATSGIQVIANLNGGGAGTSNVYGGTYTPTITFTGTTPTLSTQLFQWKRVGNVVTVFGYVDQGAGGTGTMRFTLPIVPTAFSATTAVARSQLQGTSILDGGTSLPLSGEPGGTRGEATANGAANGLRFHFSYRVS